MFSPWFFPVGVLGIFVTFCFWFLPRRRSEVI